MRQSHPKETDSLRTASLRCGLVIKRSVGEQGGSHQSSPSPLSIYLRLTSPLTKPLYLSNEANAPLRHCPAHELHEKKVSGWAGRDWRPLTSHHTTPWLAPSPWLLVILVTGLTCLGEEPWRGHYELHQDTTTSTLPATHTPPLPPLAQPRPLHHFTPSPVFYILITTPLTPHILSDYRIWRLKEDI